MEMEMEIWRFERPQAEVFPSRPPSQILTLARAKSVRSNRRTHSRPAYGGRNVKQSELPGAN
jgi:hypothetical protein